MVREVIGKADNFVIVFSPAANGRWETSIPSNTAGEYILELWVRDEAGNESYLTKALYVIDPSTLCAHLIFTEYIAEVECLMYREELIDTEFKAEIIKPRCI